MRCESSRRALAAASLPCALPAVARAARRMQLAVNVQIPKLLSGVGGAAVYIGERVGQPAVDAHGCPRTPCIEGTGHRPRGGCGCIATGAAPVMAAHPLLAPPSGQGRRLVPSAQPLRRRGTPHDLASPRCSPRRHGGRVAARAPGGGGLGDGAARGKEPAAERRRRRPRGCRRAPAAGVRVRGSCITGTTRGVPAGSAAGGIRHQSRPERAGRRLERHRQAAALGPSPVSGSRSR